MSIRTKVEDFQVGEIVLFGRSNGEKTRAEVIKKNRKKLKVKTLETRGQKKTYPVGTVWGVPPSLCAKIEEGDTKKTFVKSHRPVKRTLEDLVVQGEQDLLEGCDLQVPPLYIKKSRWFLDGKSTTRFQCEYDSQRKKLYAAEDRVEVGSKFKSLQEAQKFIHGRVLGSRWFQRRFGDIKVSLEMTRGFRKSYCRRETGLIRLLPEHLTERVLLHELTHALVPKPHAGHGRLFCAIYLDLVHHFMGGTVYESLLRGFQSTGVEYEPYKKVQR